MKAYNSRCFQFAVAFLGASILVLLTPSTSASQQNSGPATAAPAAQISPVVSINVLMVMFVDQAADAIWTAAAYPPKRACEWEQLEYRATQLATTGTLLKLGGTGSQDMQWRSSPDWGRYADGMTQYALAAAQAAKVKDIAAVKILGDSLIDNCEACHRVFKPDLPTQGIATHLTHGVPVSQRLSTRCRDQ